MPPSENYRDVLSDAPAINQNHIQLLGAVPDPKPATNLECAGRAQRRRRFGFLRKLSRGDFNDLLNYIANQASFGFIRPDSARHTKAPSPLRSAGALQKERRTLASLLLIWILSCQSLAAPIVISTPSARAANIPSAKGGSSPTVREGSRSTTTQPNPATVKWLDRLLQLFHSRDGELTAEPPPTTNTSAPAPAVCLLPTAPATDAVITRHHPTLNAGRIEGSLRLLQPEPFTLNGNTQITGDVYLPGSPAIQLNGGATHGGIVIDEGDAIPNYPVTLSGGINLPGKIHTHVDPGCHPPATAGGTDKTSTPLPLDFPASVPAPSGTRNVVIRSQSDIANLGDWQTVRDLNVKAARLTLEVPPGNYGTFTVNGNSRLNFSAGTYNFANTLNLDGSASVQTTGRVDINVAQNLIINSGAIVPGSYTSPGDIHLNVLGASLEINGSSQVAGLIKAYNGTVTINGAAAVRGQVSADSFTLNGGKVTAAVWPIRSSPGFTILGPARFDRTTGAPNKYLEQFSLPVGVTAPYTLHIQNGEPDGTNRVSSATVKLNGVDILVPSDLNQNVANVDRTVTLTSANSLEVRLASNPGSYLIINLSGSLAVIDNTAPSIVIAAPADKANTSSDTIAVSGTALDSGTGATGVAHVYVNELEATLNAADSTWSIAALPLLIGSNEVTVRAVDGANNQSTASLTITREAPNAPPGVNAGPDQTLSLPQSASLHGSASDDGNPTGSTLTTSWSIVSNTGTVTFSHADALDTTATFDAPGSYVLRLSASDGQLSASDDITITVQPANQPPTINAGPNQTIALPRTATLTGTVADDGLPTNSVPVTKWSQISGTGIVTFEDSAQCETTASFSNPGVYTLRLTASDSELSASSDVTITVQPENQAPTASAGADQIISLPNAIQLNGSMSDDGWPDGSTLNAQWTTVSGPGPVVFENANMTVTAASFTIAGVYVFRLTASDGELNGSDEVTIVVDPLNTAPLVNAGADQTVILPGQAKMLGTITDDGWPRGSAVTANWSKLSGPGSVVFANPNTSSTSATFIEPGTYVLRLTASDTQLATFDDITITVLPPNHAPTVNAGADQSISLFSAANLNGSLSDDGYPLGNSLTSTWSKLSGPGEVTFAGANTTVTTATFSLPGNYVLRLTVSDSELTNQDDVTITVNDPRVPPIADFVVPESTGTAGAFVIASSGASSPNFAADKILDSDNFTFWTTPGLNNQFAKVQFYDQQMVWIERVRLQPANAAVSNASLKNFEVQVSATTADDASFVTVLSATLLNNGQLQEFVLAGGLVRARYIKLLAKNNYGDPNSIRLGTFNPVAAGTADGVISLPGQANVALCQSPALPMNGGAIYDYSYPGGAGSVNGLLGYFVGGWQTTSTTNQFAKIQLAGGKSYLIEGVRLATWYDSAHGLPTAVKDFEVWISNTTSDDASFTRVLSATASFVPYAQQFLFPGGPVPAKYVKYVPLTNGGESSIHTQAFDVIAAGTARVVAASNESLNHPNSAQAAFDGNASTNWIATGALNNVWVKTSLANDAPQRIYGVRILPLSDTFSQSGPKDFEVRVSNSTTADSAFTTVYSGTLAPIFNSPAQEFQFSSFVDARYVQFVWKSSYSSSIVGVKELEVLAAPDRGSAVIGFSSQASAAETAANAIDIDPVDQPWVTAPNQNTNQWLKLLLPRADSWTINHIALRPGPAANDLNRSPKDFELLVSNTDAADSSFAPVLSGTLINSSQLQDFYFQPTPAKYVKLLLKNNYGSSQIGLSSFYVFSGATIGTNAQFFDRSSDSDGQIVSWIWNFGDGGTNTGRNPVHTFPAPGDYPVTLTVTDDTGLSSSRQTLFHVAAALQPDFIHSPIIVHEGGEAVRFSDVTPLLLRPTAIRQYDFGDGSILSQGANTSSHTFQDSGTFHVKLKVGDPLGTNYSITRDVLVLNMPPSVDIDPGKTLVWGEQWTSLPRISDQSPIDNQTLHGDWNFGDGQTSSCTNCTNANASVVHSYAAPGSYQANLTVTDKDGGIGTDSAIFTVTRRPTSFVMQNPPAQTTGNSLLVHGELRDTFANQTLAGKTIQFILNGSTFSAITGANGVVEISVPIPEGTKIDIVTGSFAGDDLYASCSGVGVPPSAGAKPAEGSPTHQGTDFWLMFPSAYFTGGLATQKLSITSTVSTSGTVTIPGMNFIQNFAVGANGVATVTLPFVQVTDAEVIQAKGIHVTSQQPIAVYGISQRSFSTDAFLGLPVSSLGADYLVLTYSNMAFGPSSEFGIVATENSTAVTITPAVTTGSHIAGVPYAITLNQGQTYLLQNTVPTALGDLTGSRITSTKPVAVFGGHMAATIPAEVGCCADHLLEQLPPANSWGKRFATIPLATRTKGDYFRFLARDDGTAVYLDGALVAVLNRGEFVERLLKAPAEIIATKPILVAQYCTSIYFDNGTTGKADPFFMIVPPYTQFLDHYTIATPASGFQINYANVIAPTALLGSITLDGTALSAGSFTAIGVSGYSGAQVPLAVGAHTLGGPAGFGVSVYGFAQDESYGYPGGLNLSPTVTSVGVTVAPEASAHTINTQGCVIATATDQFQMPQGGATINFTVSGANPAITSLQSDAAGQATLCYLGTHSGTDQITASLAGAQATATIIWSPPNQPPAVTAGPDQTIVLPAAAILSATATDDGLPANTLNLFWTRVSGPGDVVFANANAANTTAIFTIAGAYVLRFSANDSALFASDDVVITVTPAPANQAPTAQAGANQVVTLNENLVVNSSNEAPLNDGEVPNWIETQGSNWRQGAINDGSSSPTPQRGSSYFSAGNEAEAELQQDIDVSAFAAAIRAGTQQFEFQAYLRSLPEAVPDAGRVIVEYRDVTNANVIATLDSGIITATDGWHLTEDIRTAPAGTGWIRVRLLAKRNSGLGNDAFFDSISLRPLHTAGIKLDGHAGDDGLPAGSSLSANWTVVSGPGPVSFANSQSPSSGAIFTTPGTYVMRLTASDGELSATSNLSVIVNPANQQPAVTAGSDQTITLPANASLAGAVTDDGRPAGSSLSVFWSRRSGPGIVTFADATSANTTAAFSTPGVYVLSLTADDGEYAASAILTVTVSPAAVNQPPTVSAGTDRAITLTTAPVTLHGSAADDGLPVGSSVSVVWTQTSGPAATTFGNPDNAVTNVQFSVAGTYVLRLTASDGALSASDEVVITATPANEAPTVSAGADQIILLSQGAALNGSVSDDGLPGAGGLTTAWSMLSGPGTVSFTNPNVTVTNAQFSATGTYVLRLTASDGQLAATDDVTVQVNDNVPAPTVTITAPADGAELTAPALVTGSVSNGSWTLEYSLNTDDIWSAVAERSGDTALDGSANQAWRTVASGNAPVNNGALGTLDTTMMLNGIYSLRLRATDEYGQTSFTSSSVLVDKNLKVGHFQIAFSDLSVPVGGLPIEVVRSYDSRDNRVGDFGVGWQLGIRSARVEKTGVLGFSWLETVSSGAIPTYCLEPGRSHKVAVTFGDGKVFKFQATTAIHCQQLAPITSTRLTFTPEPGTHATLEAVGPSDVLVETQSVLPGPVRLINQNNPDIFNAGTFRLTTAEGAVYVIDQRTGVSSVRDPYGNSLTITSAGIIHSTGRSVAFTRDAANRITSITDPNGNSQTYAYDARGDLVSYTDREQQTTTYSYDSDHRLLTITDARGTTPLQNQFDASGRLIGQRDAFNHALAYDHDIAGRVETITDRLGHATRYEYDERGNVLRRVDAKGGVRTFSYDELDNVLSETNELGKTTTYTYDSADNRTSVTDPLGHATQFTYNGARQILTVTDALGQVTTNTYDAAGTNLLTATDALNNSTTYTYSAITGQRSAMQDALNGPTSYSYDGNGRLSSETDALGHVTTFTYDANGNRKSQTVTRTNALGQPETITTNYEYDKLNRPVKTLYADGSSTLVEYNLTGQQSATIDQLGHRTEFPYDDMGRLARTDYPDGTHEVTTYDAEGHRLTSTDRAGHVTSYSYDELGRLLQTTYADGTNTSSVYEAAGQLLSQTDARGNVTRYFYDDAGRRAKIKNAMGQETTFAYDVNGNQLSVTDALGHATSHEYDADNRRIKTIYADGSFDSVSYDALGRTVTKTDQADKTTRFNYDALGRLTKVTDALNQETTYTYDDLGRQLSQTDANNHTTRFEYDQLGRRTKRILPLGQVESYSYDLAGNLQTRTDFNGKVTSFAYDAMRRLSSKSPDASFSQPPIAFTYNANGQRASMVDASGTTLYAYDIRNRLIGRQTPFGALSYTYDAAGNLATTRSSHASGVSIDYAYDSLNRLATVRDNQLVTLNGGVTSYTYDAAGNLQSYLYPNQISTSYGYNSLNRLTDMTVGTSVSHLAGYSYTLGVAGNRVGVTELNGRSVTYSYDDLYRLRGETISNDPHNVNGAISYAYDAVGNRLSRTSTVSPVISQTAYYDANDRLTSDSYDNNGNTRATNGNNYDYDFENRLASFTPSAGPAGAFVYDGDGNRVGKTVAGVTTNYLVDTNNPTGYAQVVEELQSGNVTRSYTYGHDLISQRCPVSTANCSLSFYGYDGHGSVRLLTDAAGAVTDTSDYDAFGNLIAHVGNTANDYLYAGEQFDPNLGFYYLRARYMNPAAGRFWTMDSFEGSVYEQTTLHKYSYVSNEVVNHTDPSGLIGVGDIIGEVNALTCRVQLLAMDFPRAMAAGRLILAAFNVSAFFGDEEYRNMVLSSGPDGLNLVAADLDLICRGSSRVITAIGYSLIATRSLSNIQMRAEALLQGATGVNINPIEDALKYRLIISGGSPGAGTPVTDLEAIEGVVGTISTGNRMIITQQQAGTLESTLGLPEGRLNNGAIISLIENVGARGPRSPLSGNQLFLGSGQGLPGGHPEINIAPIGTAGGGGIRQVILEVK
jgi:RHS repeat-associated protein